LVHCSPSFSLSLIISFTHPKTGETFTIPSDKGLGTKEIEIPNIIIIACGINDATQVAESGVGDFNSIISQTWNEQKRQYLFSSIRWAVESLNILAPDARIFLATPLYSTYYTAMWAYAIAEYICCPPWFEGFAGFKLHSAFYKAEKTIFIDLNAVELSVVTLASAFYGCSRLEQITGILKIASNVPLTDAFKGCAVLHTVKLSGLSSNIDLSDCAQLSVETIEHLIENSIQPGSGTITITVHPDVNNNINNNSSWGNVRALLQEKTYITIQSATA
jgi:hypothetical protein